MSSRQWRRLWREQGWRPLGLLAIVILGGFLALDGLIGEHLRLTELIETREGALAAARAKQEQLPRLETSYATERIAAGGLASRLVQSDEGVPGGAGERFGQILREWYISQGVSQVAVQAVSRREEMGLVYLRGEVTAPLSTEQFNSLLQNKGAAPLALRLVEASVDVNDMTAPSALRTHMTWEGLAAVPRTSPKEKVADKKKPDKTVARTLERGAAAVPNVVEEKRK
ncbi:MAG: hypothetical protein D4R84_05140 [Rhodocyclaceae bacterium]|nr:MAG: hypothetical protein D4R84_05140 [Rhodocyclaceae bacterium]